uniref:protein-serine/threonine phosphatase n=2 Tax=Kalanchoe fedtschenkoi TaxID=63787 RepID=A0A7N0RD28_KALFE
MNIGVLQLMQDAENLMISNSMDPRWDDEEEGCNLQAEIGVVAVSLDDEEEESRAGDDAALLEMISDTKSSWAADGDCSEDDSIGDMVLDNTCSVSVVSDNSSICGDDLLDFEVGASAGSFELGKGYGDTDMISNAATCPEPPAKENNLSNAEYANGSTAKLNDLAALPDKGASSQIIRSVFGMDCVPLWGFTSFIGRRPEMEDAYATIPRFLKVPLDMLIGGQTVDGLNDCLSHLTAHFFGVYDGHGGCQVANYCRDRMHLALVEELELIEKDKALGKDKSDCHQRWRKVFTNCFVKVDDEIGGKTGRGPVAPETVGSTALVSLICSSHIIVANCGDSRAVLCRGKEPVALSIDHKPNREDELARIKAAGGKVIQWNGHRVFGVLAMSRSIGDRYLKPSIIPDPEVMFVPRVKEDECLILASDGLWDVMSNEEACDLARRRILQWHKKHGPVLSSSDRGNDADPAAQSAAEYLSNRALQKAALEDGM